MPRKRKSGLSENSSWARAAKVVRNHEFAVHAELRRQQQAQRPSVLRAAETPLQAHLHKFVQKDKMRCRLLE
ncbi:hypothetical protein J6590_105531, partial [Homalodisca vitripennis]